MSGNRYAAIENLDVAELAIFSNPLSIDLPILPLLVN
jgi:hypothetical protein